MADLYTKLAILAEKQIEKFGRTISLRTNVNSGVSYSPTITESDEETKGVSVNIAKSEIDGTLIKNGDIRFLIYFSESITTDMQIIDGLLIYSIESIDIIKPGNTLILYKVHARKFGVIVEVPQILTEGGSPLLTEGGSPTYKEG